MDLVVTSWMEKDAIVCGVSASLTSPNDVMAVPPRQFGNLVAAVSTQTPLLDPQF